MAKAKQRGKEEAPRPKENRWAENPFGLSGFIFGIIGLIIFPIIFGFVALLLGYLNMKNEKVNLWKLAIPLGLINLMFGVMFISELI